MQAMLLIDAAAPKRRTSTVRKRRLPPRNARRAHAHIRGTEDAFPSRREPTLDSHEITRLASLNSEIEEQ